MSQSFIGEVVVEPGRPLDKTAEAFLNWVIDGVVLGPAPDCLIGFSANAERRMYLELRDLPAEPDEVLRALGKQEGSTYLGLLYPAPVPENVQADRCWILACEDSMKRLDTMLALRGDNGKGGAAQYQLLASAGESPARWVGIAPSEDVVLWEMDGPVLMGPTGEA